MNRDGIGQVPGVGAGLPIAVVADAVIEAHALDTAREIDGPRHRVDIVAADACNGGELRRREVLVPAELLHHAQGYFGVTVHELRVARIGILGQKCLSVALDAEARAEGAAAILHVKVGVVENGGAGVPDCRLAPQGHGRP
jgi:hypothetical protein